MKFPRAMYSLRMSFWVVPRSCSRLDALLLADDLVEQQQHRGGRVDRHRRRDLVERDAVEGGPHVVDRVDGDAGAADLAEAARVVGVQAELGRQVEGHRQARWPRARAGTCSARWTPSPTRSPRTGASSTAACGTSRGAAPRVKGNSPGSPRRSSRSSGQVARARVERLDLDAGVGEAARVVGADDRRDGEVGRFLEVLVVDGHGRRLPSASDERARARLPSVDRAGRRSSTRRTALAVTAARAVIDERRAELRGGRDRRGRPARPGARAGRRGSSGARCGAVLNATGVILHTNLGRAPLAADAQAAVARAAEGYSNLELDLASGARGSRHDHVAALLRELTGAEAAMAVNNCAGAVLLAAAALAGPGRDDRRLARPAGRDRRRLPDPRGRRPGGRPAGRGRARPTARASPTTSARSGRTTGAILRAHPSNFRQLGFVEEVEIEELCALGVPVIDDVGSGNLAEDLPALADEPPVRRSVAAGAALVCFSGDKLLGGPQAGLLVGRADAIAAAARPPARPRAAARQALAGRARGDAARSTATPSARGRRSRCWRC